MKTVEILGFLSFLSSPSIRTVIQEIDEHQTSGGGWLDRVFTDDSSLDRGQIMNEHGCSLHFCVLFVIVKT